MAKFAHCARGDVANEMSWNGGTFGERKKNKRYQDEGKESEVGPPCIVSGVERTFAFVVLSFYRFGIRGTVRDTSEETDERCDLRHWIPEHPVCIGTEKICTACKIAGAGLSTAFWEREARLYISCKLGAGTML